MTFSACPDNCPGCRLRTEAPPAVLAEKIAFVRRTLAPWAPVFGPAAANAEAAVPAYRDRVCLAAAWTGRAWHFGLRQRRAVVSLADCPLHADRVRQAAALLAGVLPPAADFPLAYYLQSGGQVSLVVKTDPFPDTSWLTDALQSRLAETGLEGVWLHRHPAAGRRVTARRHWDLLWGRPRSTDAAGFAYGPTAFRQPLPELHGRSLDEAETFFGCDTNDLVVDLYCGLGHGAARWRAAGADVIGVEVQGESVACARQNVPDATILRGRGKDRLPQLTAAVRSHAGRCRVYVNPPRTGIEPEVLAWIGQSARPEKLAYLSCNAVSLRRDLERLTAAGYAVDRLWAYDFYPGTRYLEILALLRRC